MAYLVNKPSEIANATETRIDISKLNELDYWTFKWKISNFQLFEAMEKTKSNIVTRVEEYLKKKKLL